MTGTSRTTGPEAAAGPKTCAHCGQTCGDYAAGLGGILTRDGGIDLCHPNYLPGEPVQRPDCYRRVTVYGEPLGALKDADPKPAGIRDIRHASPHPAQDGGSSALARPRLRPGFSKVTLPAALCTIAPFAASHLREHDATAGAGIGEGSP